MDETNPMAMLADLSEDEILQMLFPYEQEQGVLSQEMALAQQLRQRGPERSTPMGALLGGLSNVVGNAGGAHLQAKNLAAQRELARLMQADAAGRMMRARPAAANGLLPTAVDDETLAALSAGG